MSSELGDLKTEAPTPAQASATAPDAERGSSAQLASGEVDHFKIARLIGRGGMGEVYLARDTKLGRKVALKVIRSELMGSDQAVERFLFEARATATFNHPNIVTVYAVGEHAGRPYLALEFLEGQSLRERMNESRPGPKEALRIGLAIADALREAHSRGILHRDLKPANIVIPSDGRLRVVDFGLAKALSPAESVALPVVQTSGSDDFALGETATPKDGATPDARRPASETSAQSRIAGTPRYMAPEQWMGSDVRDRTDVWALGLILFELLCGRLPYGNRGPAALAFAVTQPDAVPSVKLFETVPDEVAELVDRCLRKDAKQRPSADELVDELAELLATTGARAPTEESPFRGLRAFGERHAELFFGRDEEIAVFVERLRSEPVLTLVGPSGAGKSSFVHAGLVPRLKEQGPWTVLTVRPGPRPFEALAARVAGGETGGDSDAMSAAATPSDRSARLADALQASPTLLALELEKIAETTSTRVLLFVDQLEEVHTLVEDQDERIRFLEAVGGAGDDASLPVRVVLALRDDFLSKLQPGPRSREALSRVALLRSPNTEALEEILRRPLEAVGYRYDDPYLVKEMVASVEGEPSSLPLLQFACRMLWEARDRRERLLLRARYDDIGGVPGALASHADVVLGGLTDDQLELARALLLRMVTGQGTRRLVGSEELLHGLEEGAGDVLERLLGSRLVASRRSKSEASDVELELAHESLIWTWDRLRTWIERSHEELVFLDELRQAAELWDTRGRREDEVWHGDALRDADRKLELLSSPIPEIAAEFLAASQQIGDRAARRRQLAQLGALIGLGAIAAVAIVVAIAFGEQKKDAVEQRRIAEDQRGVAEKQRTRAELETARALDGSALFDVVNWNYFAARSKLRTSLELADTARARVDWMMLRNHPYVGFAPVCTFISALSYSADGSTVAVACQAQRVHLVDVQTGEHRPLPRGDDSIHTVELSPDGGLIAGGLFDGAVTLWSIDGKEVRSFPAHESEIWSLDFDASGKRLASAGKDGLVHVWDVTNGAELRRLEGHTDEVRRVRFSPTDDTVASASLDGSVRIWRLDGDHDPAPGGHKGGALCVSFSPDGNALASGGVDHKVRVWNARTGSPERVLEGHAGPVMTVDFGHDGRQIASSDQHALILLWDAGTGERLRSYPGVTQPRDLRFSPTERRLAAGGYRGLLRFYDTSLEREHWHEQRYLHTEDSRLLQAVAIRPDGEVVATGDDHGRIRLVDTNSGSELALRAHAPNVVVLAFDPTGKFLASAGGNSDAKVWDAETGVFIRRFAGHSAAVRAVAFDRQRRRLATAGEDRRVLVHDLASGRLEHAFDGHEGVVRHVAFSPDGKRVISSSWDQTIRVWSLGSSRHRVLRGHSVAVRGTTPTPDGRELVSVADDGEVRLWQMQSGSSKVLASLPRGASLPSISPDGRRVAIASGDAKVRTVGLDSGDVAEVPIAASVIGHAALSTDWNEVVFTGEGESVEVWDLEHDRLAWRTPLVASRPPLLYSHRGWTDLASTPPKLLDGRHPWPKAAARVENAADAAASADGEIVCVVGRSGEVELWLLGTDERSASHSIPGASRAVAIGRTCLVLAHGRAIMVTDASREEIVGEVSAVAPDGQRYLVAAGSRLLGVSPAGDLDPLLDVDQGATAVLEVEGGFALGFADGLVQIVNDDSTVRPVTFENLPTTPVTVLARGPRGTIAAGFGQGEIRIWELADGHPVYADDLHGSIDHLGAHAHELVAASSRGDLTKIDLAVLSVPRCELLREVWSRVPIAWQGGVVRQPPPEDHECAGP